jgi:hypothetical protein
LPTPTGPTIATCAWVSRKRKDVSSFKQGAVHGHLRGGVPRLEAHGGIEARALDAQRHGEALPPRHLIAQHEQQEVLMRHLLLTGEDEPTRVSYAF